MGGKVQEDSNTMGIKTDMQRPDTSKKNKFTHIQTCVLSARYEQARRACRWVWGGGGVLTMRKCGTLLMDTQETLRYYLCLIFFPTILQVYIEMFSGHIIAQISPRAARTYLTTSYGMPVIHTWVQFVWGVLFKDLDSPHYTSQR